MKELLNDMERVYQEIQSLQLQPTEHNISIILDTLQTLKKAFDALQERNNDAEGNSDGNDSAQ